MPLLYRSLPGFVLLNMPWRTAYNNPPPFAFETAAQMFSPTIFSCRYYMCYITKNMNGVSYPPPFYFSDLGECLRVLHTNGRGSDAVRLRLVSGMKGG